MADQINDGGPAFPIPNDPRPGSYEAHPGASLRDLIALHALAGMLASNYVAEHAGTTGDNPPHSRMDDGLSRRAYQFADAMLKAREASNG